MVLVPAAVRNAFATDVTGFSVEICQMKGRLRDDDDPFTEAEGMQARKSSR
jgi:hypothetical protein